MSSHEFPGLTGDQISVLITAYAQPLDSDLSAIAALNSTGFARQAGSGSWSIVDETGSGSVVRGTSPAITTPDIDGGTLDNAVIGGNTPAAITGTTGRFNNDLTLAGAPGKIKPATNSTTAIQIAQADGTAFISFNTTSQIASFHGATSTPITWSRTVSGSPSGQMFMDTSQSNILATFNSVQGGLQVAGGAARFGSFTNHPMQLRSNDTERLSISAAGVTVFNDIGADADFRIEGDTDTNLFVLDAGLEVVSIGEAGVSGAKLNVNGLLRTDSFRIDQTPTAESLTPTHSITISVNGTSYKIPLQAA